MQRLSRRASSDAVGPIPSMVYVEPMVTGLSRRASSDAVGPVSVAVSHVKQRLSRSGVSLISVVMPTSVPRSAENERF